MNRREALRTLAAGSAAGALAAGAVVAVAPSAVTAEPIGAELAALIERHRAFNAEMDALGERHGDAEEAAIKSRSPADRAAFKAIDDAFNEACERTTTAMDDIVAAPIATLADMRAKAAYLARIMPGTCEHNGTVAALLASMGGASEKAEAHTVPIADPMAEAVAAHEACIREQSACNAQGDEEGAEAACERAHELWRLIQSDTPPIIATHAGAVAAVQFVANDENWCDEDHAKLLRRALAHFNGRA